MVRFSTPRSIKAEQISFLAVIETCAAVALSVIFYLYKETFLHIALAALLAPFLLLRTKNSTAQALRLVEKSCGRLEEFASDIIPDVTTTNMFVGWIIFLYGLLVVIILWILNIIGIFLIKFAVIAFNIFTNFIDSFSAIPDNWRRIVLYTDIYTFPEIVPGIEDYETSSDTLRDLRTSEIFQDLIHSDPILPNLLRRSRSVHGVGFPSLNVEIPKTPFEVNALVVEVILQIWSILMAVCIYLPAFAYRLSLKSTSLLWSPLFWAFRPIKGGEEPSYFAYAICTQTKYKISRWFSSLVIVLFCSKLTIFIIGLALVDDMNNLAVRSAIQNFLVPHTIPLWQITTLINSLLTWWILFRSENFLHEVSKGKKDLGPKMIVFFRRTFVLRNSFTVYTGLNIVYIAVKISSSIDFSFPKILWYPWQA